MTENFTLSEGKFYISRDGTEVGPMYPDPSSTWRWLSRNHTAVWDKRGKVVHSYWWKDHGDLPLDLINVANTQNPN